MAASHKPSIKEQPSQDKEFLTANLCLFRSSKKIVSIKSTLFKKKSLKKYISSQGNIAFEKKGNNFFKNNQFISNPRMANC